MENCFIISHSDKDYDLPVLRLSFLLQEVFASGKVYKNCHCQIVLSTYPPVVILQLYPLLFLVLKRNYMDNGKKCQRSGDEPES